MRRGPYAEPTRLSSAVQRAHYAQWAAVEDVGVDHGRLQVAVAEQGLDGSDVGAVLEQMRRKGVPKRVGGDALRQSGPGGGLDRQLTCHLVE